MSVIEPSTYCARCRVPIRSGALWRLCNPCLLADAASGPDPDTESELAARRFGDYELGEVIGRGGMGVVYGATQVNLRRRVALKMILESELCSRNSMRRFMLEAEAAARLDHPNIVPIYEVGEHEGRPFISMKLIEGENLRRRLTGGVSPDERSSGVAKPGDRAAFAAIARMVALIARAVHHAHSNGILHRDLKPANILIDRDGNPHVTDFGLAKLLDAESEESTSTLTVSGATLGTPSYMSPEQVAGGRVSLSTDIYSLGVILYEMLTGGPPFRAATALETMRMASEQEARRPSTINRAVERDLDTICLKCLEKNPDARYRSALDLAEDLERWLRNEPILARPAGVPLRIHRWVRRNRIGAALIASLFGGLTVALVLLKETRARRNELDLLRAGNMDSVTRGAEALWREPQQSYVVVYATTLAELAALPPRPDLRRARAVSLGMSINSEPIGQAAQYAPFLRELEQRFENLTHVAISIDLRLYKSEAEAVRDAATGRVDLHRISSLQYALSEGWAPGRQPIASERCRKEGVIFASRRSGITNFAMAAGSRLALGQTNSTLSFWGRARLRSEGLRARDFRSVAHFSGTRRDRETDPSHPKGSAERDSESQAHRRVIEAVSLGQADVGVASRLQFELNRYRRGGLVELGSFGYTPDVYVARQGFEKAWVVALREALQSFEGPEDRKLLGALTQNLPIEGFDPISDADLEPLRKALRREVAEFEDRATEPATEAKVNQPN